MIRSRVLRAVLPAVIAAAAVGVTIVAPTATAQVDKRSRCTIVGTPGDDRIRGTSRDDVICGRGGNDLISGGEGRDVVLGGPGNDKLLGEQGGDRLLGGPGDDFLDGGSRADILIGGRGGDDLHRGTASPGPGHDYCGQRTPRLACSGDDTGPPALVSTSVSHSRVDVAGGATVVVLRAHVRDEVGVVGVELELQGPPSDPDGWQAPTVLPAPAAGPRTRRTSGKARDSVWTRRVTVPAYQIPGQYRLHVAITPRVGPNLDVLTTRTLVVDNAHPDTERPQILAMTEPRPGARISRSAPPRVSIQVTDDRAGIDHIWICYRGIEQDPATCSVGELASGTLLDGVWRAPMQSLGTTDLGPGTFYIDVVDRVGREVRYLGPAGWDPEYAWPGVAQLPGGAGDFTLVR